MPDAIQLTPAEVAAAQPVEPPAGTVQLTPEEVASAQPAALDVFKELSPEQLVELQKQSPEDFNIVNQFISRPDLHSDASIKQKVADAFDLASQTPLLDTLAPGNTVGERAVSALKTGGKGVLGIVKGAGKTAFNLAQAGATMTLAPLAPLVGTTVKDVQDQALRNLAEQGIAIEKGAQENIGLANAVAKTAARKVFPGTTPESRVSALDEEIAKRQQMAETLAGRGPIEQSLHTLAPQVFPAPTGEIAPGVSVRPENVEGLLDPASFALQTTAFGLPGKVIPGAAKAAIAEGAARVGQAAAAGVGRAITGAGVLSELGGKALKVASPIVKPIAATVGAVKGLEHGGPVGAIAGLALGERAGAASQAAAETIQKAGQSVADLGRQISGVKTITSPYAQLARDVIQSTPNAAVHTAAGAAYDLGLAAATSGEAPENRASLGIGTFLGAAGGALGVGTRALSGQLIGPREYGVGTRIPSSGNFPALDAMHNDAMKTAAPGIVARLNAIRSFANGAAPDTDVFLGTQDSTANALKSMGVNENTAAKFAEQKGFFTTDLIGKDGKPHRVVVVRDVDSAPHEALHAVQDVLGESANQRIDQIVAENYTPEERAAIGQQYARRISGPGDTRPWQDIVLDETGRGKDAEAEKGSPLTPAERAAEADKYILREIAAENFDSVFKHAQTGKPAVIEKLANIVGNVVTLLGGNPLEGRTSATQRIPLKPEVIEAVNEATKKGPKPIITPSGNGPEGAASTKAGAIPSTDAERTAAAADAARIASEAPGAPTVAGTASPRELLGAIAEAIAQRSGVKINYSSAPEEPAAATTSNRPVRRAMIEAFRQMPESARRLWEKNFFPEKVLKTKSGYQVQGWAPEIFASNAHKVGQFIVDVNRVQPGTIDSPYEIDPKTRSLSPAAWQQLYTDVQNFVSNQKAGKTGAGESLVIPKHLIEQGFTQPEKAGTGGAALEQRKADFINALFNLKLPETPRITGNRFPGAVVGADISAATKPGRVELPVRPRGEFTGKKAEALGIEGRPIEEVNPFRNELERAGAATGVGLPSMIEAIQKLDLNHIKEVQVAPELPDFRANSLTLRAGFQPDFNPDEKPEAIKSAAIRDENGKIYAADNHIQAAFDALQERNPNAKARNLLDAWNSHHGWEEGFVTNNGEFLNRAASLKRATDLGQFKPAPGQTSLESTRFNEQREQRLSGQFSPAENIQSLTTMPDEEWRKLKDYSGKLGGGVSGWAFDQGAAAKTPEDLAAFRSAYETLGSMGREAMKNKDFNAASNLFTKSQLAREAYEVATGERIDGGEGEPGSPRLLRQENPDFVPPLAKESVTGRFQPKGNKEEWTLRPASSGFSKAWILPNGKPVQLGGQWHHEWLAENPDIRKEYGIKKASPTEDNSRVDALKKGFARINYDARTGALTVEARQQDLDDLRPSIAKFIESNLGKVDKVQFYLFNKDVNFVEDSGSATLFDKPKSERMGAIPFISAPGEITEVSPQATAGALSEQAAPGAVPKRGKISGQFQPYTPQTQSGKDLEKRGFELSRKDYTTELRNGEIRTDEIHFQVYKGNEKIAAIDFSIGPTSANVERVHVIPQYQKKGIAETLYREMATELQGLGIKSVTGSTVHAAPEKIRNKLFGTEIPFRESDDTTPEGEHFFPMSVDSKISPSAKFQPFESKDFESELSKIRSGKSGGQTFAPDGTVWVPADTKSDIVSLASVNVPQGDLTPENFRTAIAPYEDLLSEPGIVAGAYSFSKDGKPTVSIDINAVVPQKYRDNTLKFAKDNDQRAIFDMDKLSDVASGGSGNTKLNSAGEILDALDNLRRGKPVDVDDIITQHRPPEESPTEQALPGFGKLPLGTKQLSEMTKAEVAKHYPEAVIPRRKFEPIPSDVRNSPLAKEAGNEEAATEAFARRLVEFAKENKNTLEFKLGAKWYSEFVPKLKKEFGADAQLMAELLAATSPQTNVQVNYHYALDALQSLKAGRFAKQIAKYNEGLRKLSDDSWERWYTAERKAGRATAEPTEAAFLEHWIARNNLKPRQSNGQLYGTHSIRLLQVFARRWMDMNTGPKTRTFVSNLTGTGHDATIDVWADRTMRRLGYSGFEPRWRILPQNGAPVSDADYQFSQRAFAKAARQLGMKPDELQGALWFAEKQLWANEGWGRLDLGSFAKEIAKTGLMKAAIARRLENTPSRRKAALEQPALLDIQPKNENEPF